MCESNAFLRDGDEERLVMEDVSFVEPVEGGYRLRGLFGEETVVRGRLEEINLLKHKILFTGE